MKRLFAVIWCVLTMGSLLAYDKENYDFTMSLQTYKNEPIIGHLDQAFAPSSFVGKTLTIISQPSHGTISNGGNDFFEYTPNSDYVGKDTLICQLKDNVGRTRSTWVEVIVREAPETEGTEFWCSFMANSREKQSFATYITIATLNETDVRIRNPFTRWEKDLHLTADTSVTVEIPIEQCYVEQSDIVQQKAIQVTSTAPITVYAANYEEASFDATNVLPTQSLGSEYMIQTFQGKDGAKNLGQTYFVYPPEFIVIALEDNTSIDITPTTGTAGGMTQKTTYTLSRGETILIQSSTPQALTGTEVNSNGKRIAVFAGDMCTYVPSYAPCACDHLVEQVVPNDVLGKDYIVSPSVSRVWDFVLVTALFNDTEVLVDGITHSVLNAHETDTIVIYDGDNPAHYIHTSKSSACYLYISSHCIPGDDCLLGDGTDGDPSMVYIPSIEQKAYQSVFATYEGVNHMPHYVHIVTPTSSIDSMFLDGAVVPPSLFSQVPSLDTMSIARVPISHGIHRLKNLKGGFVAHVYGLIEYESYAYNVASQFVSLWDTTIVLNDTICAGQTYFFGGKYLTKTGQYETQEPWSDTIYQLNLWVFDVLYDTTEVVTLCDKGQPYIWHGTSYSVSGLYTDTLQTIDGCDSVTHLQLTFLPTVSSLTKEIICEGETYEWHGQKYTQNINKEDIVPSKDGCDSICRLELTVLKKSTSVTPITLCIGETIEWHGEVYSTSGTYYDTILNAIGCDSIMALVITTKDCTDPGGGGGIGGDIPLNPMPFLPITDSIDSVICLGDTILWREMKLYEEGVYRDTGYYWFGWDSVYWVMNLTTKDCDTGSLTIIQTYEHMDYDTLQAKPYVWPFTGEEYTEPGFYADTIIEVKDTTIGQLLLTVDYTRTIYSCAGEKVDSIETPWGKFGFDTCTCLTGCLVQTLDSICIVDAQLCVVYLTADTVREDSAVCAGETYTWNTYRVHTITEPGTYNDTLKTADLKCDSIHYVLTLTHKAHSKGDTTAYVCYYDLPFIWHGDIAQDSSTWMTKNAAGCDSTVYLHLVVSPEPQGEDADSTICQGDMIEWHQQQITTAGIYKDTARVTMGNGMRCDSIWYTLTVKVQKSDTTKNNISICAGSQYTWKRDGKPDRIITDEGEYWDTVRYASTNCDSMIYYLNLKVEDINRDSINDATCEGTPYIWRGQMLYQDSVYHDTARAATPTECDTVYILNLTHLQPTKGDTTAYVCYYDLPFIWHGNIAQDSSTWMTKNAAGCDSTVYLHLVVSPEPQGEDADSTICQGDMIEWHQQQITTAGIYKDTARVTMGNGQQCDSIWYSLNVKVLQVMPDSISKDTICYGGNVDWRHFHLTDVRTSIVLKDTIYYTRPHCDSLRLEHSIHVLPKYTDNKEEQICTGGQYIWKRDSKKDSIITTEGEYYDTVRYVSTGCDSMMYYLKLKVGDINIQNQSASACEGSTYTEWRKEIIVPANDSIYKDTVKAATPEDCDTVFILNLTVRHKTAGDTTAYMCEGSTFYWRGQIAHDGDQITLSNVAGCDSTVTLKLVELTSSEKQDEDTTICYGESVYWSGKVWNNLTKDSTLTDTIKHKLNLLCDSICFKRIVHVREKAKDVATSETACYGSDVTWRGQTVTNITVEQTLYDKEYYKGTTCDSVLLTHTIYVENCGCPEPTIKPTDVVNMCDTLLPYIWKASKEIKIFEAGHYSDTLRTESGCDSIIYLLDLSTYPCCRPLAGEMEVRDICADERVMDVIVKMTSGHFTSYRVHYINAEGNTMPFRDTLVATAPQEQDGHVLLTLPVPHDATDKTKYPRPDTYTIAITVFDACGDSLALTPQTYNVLYPSWLLDQHWDDVIAILNDRYNGGYTFSKVEWLRNGEKLLGEDELYIYLPHQLWNDEQHHHQNYAYQALLTRSDDGKTMLTCPMEPYHKDSTNVLTEPYVAVSPTLVPKENPVVHIQTNTTGTYWLYSATGKLLQTADYEPCEHDVFDIKLHYNVQTMYILVFTPRNETRPLQHKYRVVKLLLE